jgi:hypothetical protein
MTTKGKDAKRKNSRAKGAQGEREAAKYLTSLGFKAGRMGRNGYSAEDLDCRECDTLSKVHIEVKRNETFTLQSAALMDACEQAMYGAGPNPKADILKDHPSTFIKPWAVLWKRNRQPWMLTFHAGSPPLLVTVTGDDRIRESLKWLAGTGGGGE